MGEPRMKWLFFLLVIVNVTVFGWYSVSSKQPTMDSDPIYAPPVSRKILTLNELPIAAEETKQTAKEVQFKSVEQELREITDAFEQVSSVNSGQFFCPRIEFEKEQDKTTFLPQIDTLGWPYKESTIEGEREKYWLYISAPSTRTQATRIVNALKVRGIDSFIINRGEMKNRISLGLYSVSITAERERSRISELSGYDVKVYRHLRKVPISVVQITDGIIESEWKAFTNQINFGKMMIKLEKNPC